MKYLENAFKFLGKYYLLLIPLFISVAIPAILNGPSSNAMMDQLNEIQNSLKANPSLAQNPNDLLALYSTMASSYAALGIGSFIALILSIVVMPATYGMVNKALATGNADLSDFVPEMKNNIVKYIVFGLVSLVLYFGIGIAVAIIVAICIALMAVSVPLGVIAIILFAFALTAGIYAFTRLILFWFPAMVCDNLGVFDALKKSISVGKSYFWPVVGISLLISIGSSIAAGIVNGIFGRIAIIGPTILSVAPVLAQFILIVFTFEVYRDKTGKNEYINEDLISETPGDYL